MSHCADYFKVLSILHNAKLPALENLKTKAESFLSSINSDIEKEQKIAELFRGLKRSWKPYAGRPGKSEPFYCFLRRDPDEQGQRWVFLKDLVEIHEGERLGDGAYGNLVTDDEPILLTDQCPKCCRSSPVIFRYFQEYDGPDGDCWSRKYLILCCDEVHNIKSDGHG